MNQFFNNVLVLKNNMINIVIWQKLSVNNQRVYSGEYVE